MSSSPRLLQDAVDNDEVLSSSCSSMSSSTTPSNSTLNNSVEFLGAFAPDEDASGVLQPPPVNTIVYTDMDSHDQAISNDPEDFDFPPSTTTNSSDQAVDTEEFHPSLDSTIDILEGDNMDEQTPSTSAPSRHSSNYVEDFSELGFDIDQIQMYEQSDAQGNPHVPPHLIPGKYRSRVRYAVCSACSRASDFGYKNWTDLEDVGGPSVVADVGDIFCPYCGLDSRTFELLQKHVAAVHEEWGWKPTPEACPTCGRPTRFSGPPSRC